MPSQFKKNVSCYHVSSALENERAESVLEFVSEMEESKTELIPYNSDNPDAGLSRTMNLEKCKMSVCDTGLLTTMVFEDNDFTESIIYEKPLADKPGSNLGYLYENIVVQILAANGNRLFYQCTQKTFERTRMFLCYLYILAMFL